VQIYEITSQIGNHEYERALEIIKSRYGLMQNFTRLFNLRKIASTMNSSSWRHFVNIRSRIFRRLSKYAKAYSSSLAKNKVK
jgi:hypothetical protein